jgi:hypothetical protein
MVLSQSAYVYMFCVRVPMYICIGYGVCVYMFGINFMCDIRT